MSTRALTVISTRLPPQLCGIGTYSWLLNSHWPGDKARTQFIVMDGAKESAQQLGFASVTGFNGEAQTLERALTQSRSEDLLLHYAGRAYHRYGCPVSMPRVLGRWKKRRPDARLLIFFHELPAEVPMMSRHYLPQRINARIVRKLAQLADILVTNTAHQADKLRALTGRSDVHCIAVGSNITPPARNVSIPRAKGEFVIFGLPFGRMQTSRLFADHLREWHRAGELTKLHIIGPDDAGDSLESPLSADAIIRHGALTDRDVSDLLGRAQYALSNATPETWSKSGSFMAFAAHGCPIVTNISTPEHVPLNLTIEAGDVGNVAHGELERRGAALRDWYEANADWKVIASRMAALLDHAHEQAA
jgi:hypothetical protein